MMGDPMAILAFVGAVLSLLVALVTLATVVWKGGSLVATVTTQMTTLTLAFTELRSDLKEMREEDMATLRDARVDHEARLRSLEKRTYSPPHGTQRQGGST